MFTAGCFAFLTKSAHSVGFFFFFELKFTQLDLDEQVGLLLQMGRACLDINKTDTLHSCQFTQLDEDGRPAPPDGPCIQESG